MRKRKIIRLKGHDYSQKGYYFVTIEPSDRQYSFCEIIDGKIHLSEIGKIIDDQWKWLFEQYDHIRMDEYIIMPDHMHGIIKILPNSQSNGNRKSTLCPQLNRNGESFLCPQSNGIGESFLCPQSNVRATLESPSRPREAPEPPVHLRHNHSKRLDLSHIIGAFKTTSSKLIHLAGYRNFKWKRSFNDRILRHDELDIKRNYIQNNPLNWEKKIFI